MPRASVWLAKPNAVKNLTSRRRLVERLADSRHLVTEHLDQTPRDRNASFYALLVGNRLKRSFDLMTDEACNAVCGLSGPEGLERR